MRWSHSRNWSRWFRTCSPRLPVAETVFSHPPQLDLIDTAQTADYTVVLHAVLIPEELAALRVRHRCRRGRPHVTKDQIRHATNVFGISSLQPLARADSATFYDNSDARATWTPGHADLQWPADTSPG